MCASVIITSQVPEYPRLRRHISHLTSHRYTIHGVTYTVGMQSKAVLYLITDGAGVATSHLGSRLAARGYIISDRSIGGQVALWVL